MIVIKMRSIEYEQFSWNYFVIQWINSDRINEPQKIKVLKNRKKHFLITPNNILRNKLQETIHISNECIPVEMIHRIKPYPTVSFSVTIFISSQSLGAIFSLKLNVYIGEAYRVNICHFKNVSRYGFANKILHNKVLALKSRKTVKQDG